MKAKLLASMGLFAATLSAFAATSGTIDVFNNTANTIQMVISYSGGITNFDHQYDCTGENLNEFPYQCVGVNQASSKTNQFSVAPQQTKVLQLDSNVKSISGRAFIYGAIGLTVQNNSRMVGLVSIPVGANPAGAFVFDSAKDAAGEAFNIGAASTSQQVKHGPYILSVESSNTPDSVYTAVVVNSNPLASNS